jgi:hypothetical protein
VANAAWGASGARGIANPNPITLTPTVTLTLTHHLLDQKKQEDGGRGARVVVLLIGTNNLGAGMTQKQTQEGIVAVMDHILAHGGHHTRVLLLGLLPRGDNMKAAAHIPGVNAYVEAAFSKEERVRYVNCGSLFLHPQVCMCVCVCVFTLKWCSIQTTTYM